jgi:ferritin-like metal-binding protein YciE
MAMRTLDDCFQDELRDVLSAEKQLVRALPKMAKGVASEELRQALLDHLEETEGQVERLEQAFESLDKSPRSKKCVAMEGLIEEGSHVLEEEAEDDVKDAMIIAAAQKVEHYEIATYGTLCTWAEMLGHTDALALLKENLAQEKAADEKLTKLAESINLAATT